MRPIAIVTICLAISQPAVSYAGITSQAAREAAELVLRKFGKEAEEQGLQTLTKKIEALGLKYGDEAVSAVEKVGPRTFRYVEEAGENGLESVRLLARYGDDAVWIVGKKDRLALFARYGDNAAEAMLRQGKIAEPLIDKLGKPAATVLKTVSRQNGRRLAMMAEDGTLKKIGRTDELLGVIARYGDRGMDFVWRNKKALAVAALLTAFLAHPQPFIDGTVELTQATAEGIGRPLATEIGKSANWSLVLPIFAAVAALFLGFKIWLKHRLTLALKRPSPVEIPG
ncbi:MAG TPA: hypothetical protein VFI31_20280 [Pirellulales bacterium]|nr:hypothetical protein [Pirellulales bacterium]